MLANYASDFQRQYRRNCCILYSSKYSEEAISLDHIVMELCWSVQKYE